METIIFILSLNTSSNYAIEFYNFVSFQNLFVFWHLADDMWDQRIVLKQLIKRQQTKHSNIVSAVCLCTTIFILSTLSMPQLIIQSRCHSLLTESSKYVKSLCIDPFVTVIFLVINLCLFVFFCLFLPENCKD